jgi:hypothetical protein
LFVAEPGGSAVSDENLPEDGELRIIMGMEYYFKASETSIETSRDPSRNSALNWIVVTDSQRGAEIKLAITNRNEGQLASGQWW